MKLLKFVAIILGTAFLSQIAIAKDNCTAKSVKYSKTTKNCTTYKVTSSCDRPVFTTVCKDGKATKTVSLPSDVEEIVNTDTYAEIDVD